MGDPFVSVFTNQGTNEAGPPASSALALARLMFPILYVTCSQIPELGFAGS